VLYRPGAEPPPFHHAPSSAAKRGNSYAGQAGATQAGRELYSAHCVACHGRNAEGNGSAPALAHGAVQLATDGEVFWFITKGDVPNGMPSWATLPKQQRWQIVSYVQSLGQPQRAQSSRQPATPLVAEKLNAPPPTPPFTDFRYEKPGQVRKITLKDLPAPFTTGSAGNGPQVVARPEGAWPQVPDGFKVEQYATGLDNPRIIRTAPNGDIFVSETKAGDVRVFRGITANGKPGQMRILPAD